MPFGTDAHHFARFDIVHVIGVDQIERAGFRCEDVGLAVFRLHLTERQRPEAVRIARHDHAVARQKHQRKRAFELQQSFAQRARQSSLARPGHQVQNHFGVAGCLKDGPFALQFAPQFARVGDVAVVRHRDLSLIAVHRKWLGVQKHRVAGGGVARVPDGMVARQARDLFGRENIRHMAHGFEAADLAVVAGGNPGALLAAMLQCVQAEIGQVGCFRMSVDGEHATLLVEFVVEGEGGARRKVDHWFTMGAACVPAMFPKVDGAPLGSNPSKFSNRNRFVTALSS